MNINLKVNKDFERCLTGLKDKYGEDFEILNGFHESQLNFSDFIDNFVDKPVADSTIDANANAHHKDICTLKGEKGKSEDKLFAFNKIFYELKKKYGLRTAKEWLEAEYSGKFYIHDAPSASLAPYCCTGDTEILTDKGIFTLKSLEGDSIKVLNKNGEWEEGTVKYFGEQEVYEVALRRKDDVKIIRATGNHKWFVRGQEALSDTLDLKLGDKIPYVRHTNPRNCKELSGYGIQMGLSIGLEDVMKERQVQLPEDLYSDRVRKNDVNEMPVPSTIYPSLESTPEYLYSWLAGYFAIAGSITPEGEVQLQSSFVESLTYVRHILCVLGHPVANSISKSIRIEAVNGQVQLYTLILDRQYLTEDFFILAEHRDAFRNTAQNVTYQPEPDWEVISVIQADTKVQDVYCAVTEGTHSFVLDGNILTHNCFAYDLTRLANEGLFFLQDYNNQAPKHLTTFLDDVIEFISFMCNRSSGAVGLPNVLVWTYYFWKKDVASGHYIKDPDYYLRQCFQKFIYRLNQPFLRVDQSAFVNMSIFDRPYYEALFGGVQFPDGSFAIDSMEEFIEHQKVFMEVVSEVRTQNLFTFPVLTYSLLYQNHKFVDEDFARWCSDHNCKWNDANFFQSDNVNTLSNCPVSGDTNILYWSDYYGEFKMSPIKTVFYNKQKQKTPVITVLANGKLVECKINRFEEAANYLITLTNGATLKTTARHLNKVYGKEYVETKDLTTADYIPYSTKVFSISENLTYEEGKLVGMFLGDGSYRNRTEVTFSLNPKTDEDIIKFLEMYCSKHFGAKFNYCSCTSDISGKSSCLNVNINSAYLRGLIAQFVLGDSALTKDLSLKALSCSVAFRRGIVDGLYATDGNKASSDDNRIYTSSPALKDSLIVLFASLGITTKLYVDEREGRFSSNPCYTVRWFTPKGITKRKNSYILDDEYMWIKIKSIEKIPHVYTSSYCLEVLTDNVPEEFMLGNGIITHNCRLLSQWSKLSGHINSIGGSALSIGSVKVNTINLMRIAYESECDEETYLRILKQRAILCCKTLDVVRHIIARNVEKGLLPNYCEGGVDMSKQYATLGLLGLFEVIEHFGYTSTDPFGYISYTDEGIQFAERIFAVLNNVKDNFTNDYSINIESVPGESCAIKLCQKDNLLYEQNDKFIYSNQWIPLSEKCTINEKIRLSAKLDVLCSGGAIAHINLEQNFPNTDAAWDMLNKIADAGVIYFAFNTKLNECENHHGFVGTDLCPECGKPTIDTWQRIVGFLQPVRHYSKDRKKEFSTRQWYQYAELRGEH